MVISPVMVVTPTAAVAPTMPIVGVVTGPRGVMPGMVATPGTMEHSQEEAFNRVMSNQAIKKRVTPEHFAGLIAFLLGPLTGPAISNRVLCDYSVGFLASPSLGLGKGRLTAHDLAKFPIITFPRKTQPYEVVRTLFNRPDLPPMRLHASASLATVIHMAIEGLGIAVIPTAIVENEMTDGRLQLLSTNLQMPPLTFSASWLASPDTVAVERVAELAASLAQGGVIDAPLQARH